LKASGHWGKAARATLTEKTEMAIPDPLPLLATCPVVPVLTIDDANKAVPLAQALLAGGLGTIEITLRTDAAIEAIRLISQNVPGTIVGVGTVTRPADIDHAVKAGAKYLVSPGTPAELARALAGASVPAIPGCATASEAMALAALGFKTLKFFPAESCGGIGWLKSVSGPLPDLKFCPTGGIDMTNADAYLALSNVVAVGGSWVAPAAAVSAGDYARITALAREAKALRP
jgi:2-dehydro-3-deoxyphosphogluconate aldolase / (4S)-4-hydroxy-2-oxoglutarate aldolase